MGQRLYRDRGELARKDLRGRTDGNRGRVRRRVRDDLDGAPDHDALIRIVDGASDQRLGDRPVRADESLVDQMEHVRAVRCRVGEALRVQRAGPLHLQLGHRRVVARGHLHRERAIFSNRARDDDACDLWLGVRTHLNEALDALLVPRGVDGGRDV